MASIDKCGCSGVRTCLICQNEENKEGNDIRNIISLAFCNICHQLFQGSSCSHEESAQNIFPNIPALAGVIVVENFINKQDEMFMLSEIEKFPWKISQSGRLKQDFGPKANFKKRKVHLGRFTGLPSYSKCLVSRLKTEIPELQDFQPVELCHLDYSPERGASIDPHLDDSWLWGERLVTLNLLSDSILTLNDREMKYEVKIPMKQHSLVILKDIARYEWLHGIKRTDIKSRRIAITLRELSSQFLTGENYMNIGSKALEIAASFNGKPTTS